MKINKTKIKAARILQEKKLAKLLSEAKTLNHLAESKSTQQIKLVYVNEIKRLVHNIKSFYLFEFIAPQLSDAISALHDIMIKNKENEIGRYLNSLGSIRKNAAERLAKIGAEEKGVGEFKPVRHGGYGGPRPDIAGAGAGTFSVVREAIKEGFFDFFKSKKSEPYVPTPNKVLDPKTGEVIGTLGMEKTTAGKAADLTREREQLTDMANQEEPKIIAFITAYYSLFDFFAEGQPLQILIRKVDLFGGTKLDRIIKKTFGKVEGFNTKAFANQIAEDESIIRINLRLNQKHAIALTNVSKEFEKVPMDGILGRAVDFLRSAGYGGSPKGGIGSMSESKKTFKK